MNTKPYRPYEGRRKHTWLKVLLALILIAALVFAALEVYIAVHSRSVSRPDPQPSVMVIFGCQMKQDGPSVLLRDRLDTALAYWEAHPDIKIVVTGGKGDDEHVSEAQGMHDYLVAHGVDGANIYKEDQSRNTWQNVTYTRALLEQIDTGCTGVENCRFLLVSSGFHLARIQMLWGRVNPDGLSPATLAAPVSHAPSAVQMFFREPLALVKSFLLDR